MPITHPKSPKHPMCDDHCQGQRWSNWSPRCGAFGRCSFGILQERSGSIAVSCGFFCKPWGTNETPRWGEDDTHFWNLFFGSLGSFGYGLSMIIDHSSTTALFLHVSQPPAVEGMVPTHVRILSRGWCLTLETGVTSWIFEVAPCTRTGGPTLRVNH